MRPRLSTVERGSSRPSAAFRDLAPSAPGRSKRADHGASAASAARPVPFHRLEPALLAELADGPRRVVDLAAAVGRPTLGGGVVVAAALRSMRARGLVRFEPGPDGVTRWSWVQPLPPRCAP